METIETSFLKRQSNYRSLHPSFENHPRLEVRRFEKLNLICDSLANYNVVDGCLQTDDNNIGATIAWWPESQGVWG